MILNDQAKDIGRKKRKKKLFDAGHCHDYDPAGNKQC